MDSDGVRVSFLIVGMTKKLGYCKKKERFWTRSLSKSNERNTTLYLTLTPGEYPQRLTERKNTPSAGRSTPEDDMATAAA